MSSKSLAAKKNLLLCFDAFGTLFTPNTPIPVAYARAAARHGINCGDTEEPREVGAQFKAAFKEESKQNPNYGKATGLGAEKWWGNVIRKTFNPFLKPNQEVPSAMVTELLHRYSTDEGYDVYPDVLPFFQQLRNIRKSGTSAHASWPYEKTVVGIVTNSDDRVPGILESFGLRIGPRRMDTSDHRSQETIVGDDIAFVVLSYDVGVEKPEQKMFDAAIDMLAETLDGYEQDLQVTDFEKLYIGDELEKDYYGARAAGWHAVLLDRQHNLGSRGTSGLGWAKVAAKAGNEQTVQVARSMGDVLEWRPHRE